MEPEEPELTPEEKAKAQRALNILYCAMVFFIIAPFVVYWLFKREA